MVDLYHSRHLSKQLVLSVRPLECFNTLPVPLTDPDKQCRCRYVYGYGTDGSDQPSYLVWPCRAAAGHFWFVDPITGRYFDPDAETYLEPLGLEHFFDAFGLESKRDLRVAAADALGIPLEDIQPNLVVEKSIATRFHLTPIVFLKLLLRNERSGTKKITMSRVTWEWILLTSRLN